jgi:uncharacterized protein
VSLAADDALRGAVLDYLARHNVLTLSTAGPAGPWAAAVFYVNEGLRLYFLSSPRSRHAENLAADPRAAGAIHEDYRDWPEIKGVQLEGRVAPVPDSDVERVRGLYAAKFPVVGNVAKMPPAIAAALAGVRWYALTPAALHFIDNSAGFGKRRQLLCAAPAAPAAPGSGRRARRG